MSRNAAVIGSPISHSLSPALHRAAYSALGLDWVYWALEVDAEQLPGFVEGLAFGEIRIDNLGQHQYGYKNVQYAKKRRFFMGKRIT